MADIILRNLTFVEVTPGVEWFCAAEDATLRQNGPGDWTATIGFPTARGSGSVSDDGVSAADAFSEASRAQLGLHMAVAQKRVRLKTAGHFQDGERVSQPRVR